MPDIEQAHVTLVRELAVAQRTFSTNRQEGVTYAANAFLEFVGETVDDLQLHVPLVELVGALIDATAGRANPLFKPAAHDPAADRTRIADDVNSGRAAAVVTLLMEAGDSPNAAAIAVSRALGNSLNAEQIKDRRKRITRGNGKRKANDIAVSNYDETIANARRMVQSGLSKRHVAREALAFLSTTTARQIVEQPPS